jgi:hypothetical protein
LISIRRPCVAEGFGSLRRRASIAHELSQSKFELVPVEEANMTTKLQVGAAIAGAAMLLGTTGPSTAFTLSSPSLEEPLAQASVEQVWWDRWGRWHSHRWGWGWHRWARHHPWGWHGPMYGFYGPARHCWMDPWGGWRCV